MSAIAAVTATLPNYPVTKIDFWDKPIDHVDLGEERVHVVLEDAIKEFYGSDHSGNIARDTKSSLEAVLTGVCQKAHPEHFAPAPTVVPRTRAGGANLLSSVSEELRTKLPATSVTEFHPKLPSGTISKKVHHAVPQLFAKTFLQHFFARSPLVLQHSHESLELDSAMRGGTLGVAEHGCWGGLAGWEAREGGAPQKHGRNMLQRVARERPYPAGRARLSAICRRHAR